MIIKIDNYVMNPGRFVAGTRGSYGIEQVDFELSSEWEGLTVSVSFYPPEGDPVAVLYTGLPFNIPSEVMNVSGTSKFVVSGYCGKRVLITVEGMVRVLDTSIPTENAALTPTPTQVSQIMSALGSKVDIVSGKGLSSNDFSDAEKDKLSGVESGAQVNVQPDWSQTDNTAPDFVKNKPLLDTIPTAGSERGVTSGGVLSALAEKADAGHNHNSSYSPLIHEHTGTYAPSVHNHNTSYSAIGHNHDMSYATAEHNHDLFYSMAVHNHDNAYAPKNGLAQELVAGNANNLSPVKHIDISGILLERTTGANESANELASAELKRIDGMSVVQLLDNGNFADSSGWEAEGGTIGISDGICTLTINPPPTGGESEADFSVELGATIIVDGYDTGLQTCEESETGIVSITELASGEGWEIEGLATGNVTLTVYEDGDEIESFTIEVVNTQSAEEVEVKVKRAIDFISVHKYYLNGEIKSPASAAGIVIFADDGSENEQSINSEAMDDWQQVSGIITAAATGQGIVGIKDIREFSASAVFTGTVASVSVNAETFSKKIRAFSTAFDGDYTFVYNGGWKLNDTGSNLDIMDYGITVTFGTSEETLRAGSSVTVTFSYPFARSADAVLTTDGFNGISNLSVNASEFAGALGYNAVSGSYTFTFVTGTGWTFNGGTAAVQLSDYGLTGTAQSAPYNGSTITVSLTVTEEVIKIRKLMVYDLTLLGMESLSVAELDGIVGNSYKEKGLTNAIVKGVGSTGNGTNEFSSGVTFNGNYELCRLPDGISDTLDIENGKLYRRITYKTITGQNGGTVMLDGAKSGTAYICAEGNIGSISGTTLTLTKSVSNIKVYYEMSSAITTDITEPAVYRAATGGVETLLKYDSASENYVLAPLGVNSVISYTPDCARQIEADRILLQGLLTALGIVTTADAGVNAVAEKIATALTAFVM